LTPHNQKVPKGSFGGIWVEIPSFCLNYACFAHG